MVRSFSRQRAYWRIFRPGGTRSPSKETRAAQEDLAIQFVVGREEAGEQLDVSGMRRPGA